MVIYGENIMNEENFFSRIFTGFIVLCVSLTYIFGSSGFCYSFLFLLLFGLGFWIYELIHIIDEEQSDKNRFGDCILLPIVSYFFSFLIFKFILLPANEISSYISYFTCFIPFIFVIRNQNKQKNIEAFYEAISKNEKNIVQEALNKNYNTDIEKALRIAIEKEYIEIVQILFNSVDIQGYIISSALCYASQYKNIEIVKFFIKKGATIEYYGNAYGELAIDIKGYDDNIKKCKGEYKWTPLMIAAWSGNKSIVELLISKGANIEAEDYRGWSSLMIAAKKGHKSIVELLISKGASVFVNNAKNPAFIVAFENGHNKVAELLIEKTNVNIKDKSDMTHLMYASRAGYIELVDYLIRQKANIEAKDNDGWTALLYAAYNEHRDIVEFLLKKGANIEAKNNDGNTILIELVASGKQEMAKFLIQKGANAEAKNAFGQSIPDIIKDRRLKRTQKILKNISDII